MLRNPSLVDRLSKKVQTRIKQLDTGEGAFGNNNSNKADDKIQIKQFFGIGVSYKLAK